MKLHCRLDFVALALEALDRPAAKSGWGVARFAKFCKTYKLVGWMTGDPEFVDLDQTIRLPANAIGSMGLLSHRLTRGEGERRIEGARGGGGRRERGGRKTVRRLAWQVTQ